MKSVGFSIWEQQNFYHDRDVVIIGLGIVGLQTAIQHQLQRPESSILILEQSTLPIGASSRNAGFACFGSVSELLDDVSAFGAERVMQLIQDRWEGLTILRDTIGDSNLDYQRLGGYEIFNDEQDKEIKAVCFDQLDYCNELVADAIGQKNCFSIKKNYFHFGQSKELIFNQYEGQIDTGKMYTALLSKAKKLGIDIYHGWKYIDSHKSGEKIEVKTNHEINITTRQLVIATNAFTHRFMNGLDLKPGRNQVLITKPIKSISFRSCFHYDKGYVYFRNFQNRLLIGGGRNIDPREETDEFGTTENIKAYLRGIISKIILPNQSFEEDFWWSGIIATGSTKEPIIKEISPQVHLAVRFGGMGVALGSLVGKKMAAILKDKF